jgi:hypothetical protein
LSFLVVTVLSFSLTLVVKLFLSLAVKKRGRVDVGLRQLRDIPKP